MLAASMRYFWRELLRKPFFYLIQCCSLALGILSSLLMLAYVSYHHSFDKQIPDYENVYRVQYNRWGENGEKVSFASASPTIGPAIKNLIPSLSAFARLYKTEGVFSYGEHFFEEKAVFQSESSVFNVLGIKVLAGDEKRCLDETGSMAISESLARKYFGSANPLGKSISYNQDNQYVITAVFEDLEPNRHLQAEVFLSLSDWMTQSPEVFSDGWFYSGFYTYLRFTNPVEETQVNEKITNYIDQEFGPVLKEYGMGMSFLLQPVSSIHLNSHYMHELQPNPNRSTMEVLAVAAFLILFIGWFNYFNLTSIAMLKRKKEILVRKLAGASNNKLFRHYLIWSLTINLAALILVLLLLEWINNWFVTLAGMPQQLILIYHPAVWLYLMVCLLGGTFFAGIYVVFRKHKSGFAQLLKGDFSQSPIGIRLKRALVFLQFTIGIGVIAATLTIYLQFMMLINHSPGFATQNVISFKAPGGINATNAYKIKSFEDELEKLAFVQHTAFSSVIPTEQNRFNRGGIRLQGEPAKNGHNFRVTEISKAFFDVYEIPFLQGEGFIGRAAVDSQRVVINEMAASRLGFDDPAKAVGQQLLLREEPLLISGIIPDIYQRSPKDSKEPQLYRYPRRYQGSFSVKLSNLHPEQIAEIQAIFEEYFPQNPFDYHYMNTRYQTIFAPEKRVSLFFGSLSLICILITVFGLIGLSAYTAEIRKKELGIRKALGAETHQLLLMLSKEYVLLGIAAAAVALPLYNYLISRWIIQFDQQIERSWTTFALPVAIVLFVAITTVSLQSLKAIMLSVSKSLRTD
ncbi:MAG: ABC transporter permease [Bacteroidetes bacterium]|jgi:putative ABC transport system permease protein|nr:ABC transporter permease [Bacteroidota bacterium]